MHLDEQLRVKMRRNDGSTEEIPLQGQKDTEM